MTTLQLDAALYDLMVDWSKRLENELPFFQYYLRKINTSSILDVACGSGRHSIEFAKIGYQITGIDVNPHMIELARMQLVHQRLEETNIRFLPVSFEEMINNVSIVPGPFHIITCIGNSISLLASNNSLHKLILAFYNRLLPNGQLIIQIANYGSRRKLRHWAGPMVYRSDSFGNLFYFIKFFDKIDESRLKMTIVVIHSSDGSGWKTTIAETPIHIFDVEDLTNALHAAGFVEWQIFGNYQRVHFEPDRSQDIIIVAKKIVGNDL